MQNVVIYGAGGHARVVIDIIEKSNNCKIFGLIDDTGSTIEVMGYPVFKDISNAYNSGIRAVIVAIGDNWQRSNLVKVLLQKFNGLDFVTCIHPSARIGRNVLIDKGTVVMAGCNINPHVCIQKHSIVNTGANVDHDCKLGEFTSLAPGVTLGGNVSIGNYSAIGLGASIIHKINIGSHVVVGAGSVVVKDIADNSLAYGNPCRTIMTRDAGASYL